ncbi:hypothetical protein [Anaerorhabdus sp.]|uniref:hypothetical protein n=1 Tax=Anaerorhabdus sp. TaxID=1872524 RepID=UPI002FCB550C
MKKTGRFYVYLFINIILFLLFIFSFVSLIYPNEIYNIFVQHIEDISYLGSSIKMLQNIYALLIIFTLFMCLHIYQHQFDKNYNTPQIQFSYNNKSFRYKNVERDEYKDTTIISGTIQNITEQPFDYVQIQLLLLRQKQIVGVKEYFFKEIDALEEKSWILWFNNIEFDSVRIKISTRDN